MAVMFSFSDHQDRPDEDHLPSTTVCARCKGINLDTFRDDRQYYHSLLGEIVLSARTCGLCDLIYKTCRHDYESTEDTLRYRYYIDLSGRRDPWNVLEDHESCVIRTSLSIRVVDTTPWLGDPRYRGGGKHGKIAYHADKNGHATIRGRPLHCFTLDGDPAADFGIPPVRLLGSNTSSEESFKTAKKWLAQCLATETVGAVWSTSWESASSIPEVESDHTWSEADVEIDRSIESLVTKLPRRLIDLQPSNLDSGQIRIVETTNVMLSYATLSYCWGTIHNKTWLTEKGNLHKRTSAFNIESMPKTVREAFIITSRLGFRYIWVDALCIVQDDAAEWARESANMGNIYHESVVTIVASSSRSAEQGCFNTRSRSHFDKFINLYRIENVLKDGAASSIFVYQSVRPDLSIHEITEGPWSRRGWTYQEQIFARRILYMSESQLFWDCEHCHSTEDGLGILEHRERKNSVNPILRLQGPLNGVALLELWYTDVVREYSGRALTFSSDRLAALSGLAKAVHLKKGVEYLAGIWKDSVLTGLLWRRTGAGSKAEAYRCPSWSWLSQDSGVTYELAHGRWLPGQLARRRFHGSMDIRCSSWEEGWLVCQRDSHEIDTWHDGPFSRVLDACTNKDMANPFGTVTGGHVDLRTRLVAALRTTDRPDGNWGWELRSTDATALMFPSCSPNGRQGVAYMDNDVSDVRDVVCALLIARGLNFVFLLLELVDSSANVYKRIGIAEAVRDELTMIEMRQMFIRII